MPDQARHGVGGVAAAALVEGQHVQVTAGGGLGSIVGGAQHDSSVPQRRHVEVTQLIGTGLLSQDFWVPPSSLRACGIRLVVVPGRESGRAGGDSVLWEEARRCEMMCAEVFLEQGATP